MQYEVRQKYRDIIDDLEHDLPACALRNDHKAVTENFMEKHKELLADASPDESAWIMGRICHLLQMYPPLKK